MQSDQKSWNQAFLDSLRIDYAGQNVLVTGASGFLGQHVCKLLAALGSQPAAAIHRTSLSDQFCVPFDLKRVDMMKSALESVEPAYIIHLGASLNRSDTDQAQSENEQINVQGTANLLEAIQSVAPRKRPKSLVMAGTADVYGDSKTPCREDQELKPLNSYGKSKVRAWQLALQSSLPCVEARIFMLYGPGQSPKSFVGDLLEAVKTGREFNMSPGEQTRDFVWVEDAAQALLHFGRTPQLDHQSVNLCTGREHSLKESVILAETILGRKIVKNLGAFPYRKHECFRLVGDPKKLNDSGFECQSKFEDGLNNLLMTLRKPQ